MTRRVWSILLVAAAAVSFGTMCVSMVLGPVIQRMVPLEVRPAILSMWSPSAASRTGTGVAPSTWSPAFTRY